MSVVTTAVLAGTTGAVVIAVVALLAVVALVWAVSILGVRDGTPKLEDALSPYQVGHVTEQDAALYSGSQDIVQTPTLQRVVNAIGAVATRRGLLQYLKGKLEQAEVPVRPAEALFIYLVAVILTATIALVLGNAIVGLIVAAVVGVVPWVVLGTLATRRTDAFTAQLPDMLQLLGTTLRSGFSILQGLDTVARQLGDPLGEHMRHVVAEARLGRPLIEALSDVADQVHSDDFAWVVSAIAIQREVGGNLAELLDIVSETMNARDRLRREVKTLTAEGRIGAIIISIMPVAIGLYVYAVNPSYIDVLVHSVPGKIVLYASIALAGVGILWIRKIVKIVI